MTLGQDFDHSPYQARIVVARSQKVAKPLEIDGQNREVALQGILITPEGVAADAKGHKYLRGGSVMIPSTTIPGAWRLCATVAELDALLADAAKLSVEAVRIIDRTWDMQNVGVGEVVQTGAILSARLYDRVMPSIGNNAVEGLQRAAFKSLNRCGYKFASQNI